MGVAKVPARTVIGAYEFVSAPFELPAGFKPLMQPEFSWQYFEDAPPKKQRYGRSDAGSVGHAGRVGQSSKSAQGLLA